MTPTSSALSLRICLCLAALILPIIDAGQPMPSRHGSAFAQSAGLSEKEAFDAAKDLGTVDAWNAFLSNYPAGFHADLARAYIKKLTQEAQAAPPSPSPAAGELPAPAGSWGGVVRDGPGKQYRQIDSLKEGEPVTLLGRSDELDNGFPWFKISFKSGTGYQWGGILCSAGAERPDVFKTCPAASPETETKEEPRCKNGGEWDGLRCRPAGYFDKAKKSPPQKKCPAGQYLNQNGVCQPNETGQ